MDDPPDVSCKESTRQYALDGPLLSCKQQAWCLDRELSGHNPEQHGGLGGIVRRPVDKLSDGLGV